MSDKMKVSFRVEITGCDNGRQRCPHLRDIYFKGPSCGKLSDENIDKYQVVIDNRYKLTESCLMVKKQFEALI